MPEPTEKPDQPERKDQPGQQEHKGKPNQPEHRSLRQIIEEAGIKVGTDRQGTSITIRPGSGK